MATCVVTGTVLTTATRESAIVTGGATVLLTLTGDTWVAAGGTFDGQRQNIINGMTSAQSETNGWNNEVKAKIAVTDVVRTSNTLVTITLDAEAAYNITALDVVTVTVPSTAVAGAAQIVATPVFTIVPVPWTFYISTSGSDSNNGLSADATTANTNKPWLTVAKVFHAGSAILPGDTIYFGPGSMFSTPAITPIAGLSSSASPTAWRGDPTNAQGFKNSSGVRFSPGLVWITTRTATGNEEENTAGTVLLNMNTSTNNGFQFYDICFEAGRGRCASPNASVCVDLLFQDCRFVSGGSNIYTGTAIFVANTNWTFRRCTFIGNQYALETIANTAPATADVDVNIQFEHCLFLSTQVTLVLAPSGGNLAGGVDFVHCTAIPGAARNFIDSTALRVSTVTPCTIIGCLMIGGNKLAQAGTSGQITDLGYNRTIGNGSSFTNITQSGNTKFNVAPNIVLPDLWKWAIDLPRPDWFSWTNAASAVQNASASGNTQADFRGRTVRPWGAGTAIGYLESIPAAQDTGSAITGGGANSLKLTGGGEISIFVPVDAASTTISIVTKSTSYGGTNYPQLIVVARPDLGITTDQSVTASSASEQTITSPSFTPSAKGVVEVRLISRSSSVSSSTYFDTVTSP